MSAIQTIADAARYGLTIAVRCDGCERSRYVSPSDIATGRDRSPWSLRFKCSGCGGSAAVRRVITDESVEEDRRREEADQAARESSLQIA